MNKKKIKKAVIPAAGFGTRFLPFSKSTPKEMIPVVDTPVIHHVVKEASKAGITEILMIIGRGKRAIEEYFDRSWELEQLLDNKGKKEELAMIREITEMANIHFIWQKEMMGLGHAVMHAKTFVGDDPFVVMLGDTIIETPEENLTQQLVHTYEQLVTSDQLPVTGNRSQVTDNNNRSSVIGLPSVIALEQISPELTNRYGVIDGEPVSDHLFKATDWIEKPSPEEAPSNLAVASRYLFSPAIFRYLEKTKPGKGGEIQLTDAMRMMVQEHPMYGLRFEGKRHDMGNKLDFLKTNVLFGMKDPDIGTEFREWLEKL